MKTFRPAFQRSLLGVALASIMAPASAEILLSQLVVTASRLPESVNDSLVAVTLITREDIERSSARDLPELLARTPGVSVAVSGGLGKQTSLYLRGTNPGHTLVLIDGVRTGSATAGPTALNFIPLSQIERIEIVRGSRSSLYGAEAVGGVIHIITRDDQGGLRTDVLAGSNQTAQLTQSFGYSDESTRASLTASLLDTRGFNAQENAQPDRDGHDSKSVAASVDHNWGGNWRAGASLLHARGENEYDNPWAAPDARHSDEFVQQVISAYLGHSLTQSLDLLLQLGQSRDESVNRENGRDTGDFTTVRDTATLQLDYQVLPSHTLTLGLDYYRDKVDASVDYAEDSRDNRAAFVQWQARAGMFDWQLSARHDDNEAYGTFDTWNAALGYSLSPHWKLYAALGTAFKAPTFNDLYWPVEPGFRGNPNLRPEESRSWELGIKGSFDGGRWGLAYFNSDITDLLTYDFAREISVNLDEAEIQGVEAELEAAWRQWRLSASATYLDAEDSATGRELARRPRWSGQMMLEYGWRQYLAALDVQARGRAYDDAGNNQRLSGFATLGAALTWQPSPQWRLKAEVRNLLDKDYQLVQGYFTEGRTYWLRLSYQL